VKVAEEVDGDEEDEVDADSVKIDRREMYLR
jgi:hypothetical protein